MSTSSAKKPALLGKDPVLAAIDAAPVVEFTPDEDAAFDVGMADIQAGRVRSADEVRAEIERRRSAG
jgi:predicted transcriptional regulator